MMTLRYFFTSIVGTALRFFPWPARAGLVRIGSPDGDSPVLVTGNYLLTVERVKRALSGLDAYLLVANSRGINVWCASAGGHFTHHDVVAALKTSGIEALVNHRRVILPQLAATGVEGRLVQQKSGWHVVWGPTYAKDIPRFLTLQGAKPSDMRQVEFPWTERLQMAVMWAFPLSLLAAVLAALLWRGGILPLTALIWGLSLAVFLAFPLFSRWLGPEHSFAEHVGVPLLLWSVVLVGLALAGILLGALTWAFMLRWGLLSLALVFLLGMDLSGSTPVYKSGTHEDRLLKVILDEDRCRGAAFCEQVCPRDCYQVDAERRKAAMPRAERCVQCGACIVQCPFDALHFRSPSGAVVSPETVRRFKLNLMGKRAVREE